MTDATTHAEAVEDDAVNAKVHAGIESAADAVDHGSGEHWSDLKFVYLALGLAAITAVEVALSYMVDDLGPVFLPALLILMLVKFFAVVMYFMHLKFDNRLFSVMFYMGLGLAVMVYTIALLTFEFFSS